MSLNAKSELSPGLVAGDGHPQTEVGRGYLKLPCLLRAGGGDVVNGS